MSKKILVTGATGNIGKALIHALQAKNAAFVAGVRDIEQAAGKLALPASSLVHFDWNDPASFEGATENVDRVFLLGPPMVPGLDKLLTPFVDFLKNKGITRVVYLSSMAVDKMGALLAFHTMMEQKLSHDGFDFTILKPSFFAQNFRNYEWENIMQRGVTYVTAGDGKVGFIDVQDIGNVAAAVLTEEGHGKRTYELTGPEALSYHDAAAILSKVTGKHIVYPNPTGEAYAATLKAAGAPDFIAPYMTAVYSVIANGHVNFVTDNVETITGKKPTTLIDVLTHDFA